VSSIISVSNVSKRYRTGLRALEDVSLEIRRGEILALLGPNGAGKTTLINIICGIVTPSAGRIIADGHDVVAEPRAARQKIGLVPQELVTDLFERVWDTVKFSRGLFGCRPDPHVLDRVLRDLSLWEKKDTRIMALSGGMKRRVMIAKALSHEPSILFLDEPSAGVDVELRHQMWEMVRGLRDRGVTIILTTHYLEEAEEMADRVGVIHHGRLILVEDKRVLMKQLGKRVLTLRLCQPLEAVPAHLARPSLSLSADGHELVYTFSTQGDATGIPDLLEGLGRQGIRFCDLRTTESSLEQIFVDLLRAKP
jgi:ABC-2 type transport system ATP-binding protein